MAGVKWVFLAYRLPREPSTPRISLWRKLRRLGVAQVVDNLVALPLDARTREQLEWLADEVIDAGGEASIWLAEATSGAQEHAIAERMAAAVAAEYEDVIAAAEAAVREPEAQRRRTLARLRRELRRIGGRDYFPSTYTDHAHEVVEALASSMETAS